VNNVLELIEQAADAALSISVYPIPAILVAGAIRAILTHRRRDSLRFFTWEQKRALRAQAGDRCEHKPLLWRRCSRPAEEADHIMPWSRGGSTTLTNGQYLCHKHNKRKSARIPTPLYRWRLHHRRRHYSAFPVPVASTPPPSALH
jgi:hypothetical protein